MSTIPSARSGASSASSGSPASTAGLDPRGPRFAATLTSVALVAVLLLPSTAAIVVLAAQTLVFALGASRGVQRTPYAWLFRTLVRPHLAAPAELEDPRPLRFAQRVGLVFSVVGLVALLAGATVLGQVAVGLALVAAVLNAAVGYCLGCELYVVLLRLRPPTRA